MGKKDRVRLKGHINRFLKWPFILGIFLLATSAMIFAMDKTAGMFSFFADAIYLFIAFILLRVNKTRIMSELINFASEYNLTQRQMMHSLSIPYVLLDDMGRILWTNKEMENLLAKDNVVGKNITMFFPLIEISKAKNAEEMYVCEFNYNDLSYRAEFNRFDIEDVYKHSKVVESLEGNQHLIAAYFFDVTETKQLIQDNVNERMVACQINIDNYDEVMENIEEVRRSLLSAMIDRVVTRYFTRIDGVIKKLEKDKYLVIFKYRYLEMLMNERFTLLEEVKSVNFGNSIAVTLSAGIGFGEKSYIKNFEYSRMAMDMALGRGGDQVVVKSTEKVDFFGGKSKSVEKQTRVKARVKALALREIILSKDNVLIMGHKIGDVDSFGSSIGIYRCIKSLNKTAKIVINDVTHSMQPMYERFTVENGYEEDLFVNSEQALSLVNPNTVVIVVDVNRPSYTDCPELLEKASNIVVLDHHRRNPETIENAVLSYIEPFASSASEMVSEILQYINDEVVLTQEEVDALYAGIMIDTNNFTNRTGVRTFEAAAFLRRRGADVTRVRMLLRDDMEDYKAKAKAIENAEVYLGDFAITCCEAKSVLSPTVVGAQSANELLNIRGIKAAFVLTPYNNQIYISARSIDTVNVQLIMERLGGGGHSNIAGAQLDGDNIYGAIELLKNTIREMKEQGDL
ncbi:DHH family phosphoesterase [Eubacterium uniforme]|uniref:Cyclic-di-AMP phosphodiesterase n=1 Tax=Eubacterium uniforme TaxID=39495 RepID=A0A1T4VR74_9FIRM|nr:DHH family phosphoesterase [Eubacterium uniforme]SKA67358.1 c-di-AMP phosphodiesterase, consists of a GGDEF-like and DHH domains [Eubacterium uniforme]HAH17715.1 DHH family phosphoesterase [Eubacterium sp.]